MLFCYKNNGRCRLSKSRNENDSLMLTSEFVPSRTNPDQIPHLVVIPEISFCERIQKVTYILGESAELWFTNSTDNIIYTYCLYNEAEFRYEFWYDDELIAWVKSDGYRFSDDRGLNIFRLATVCFHPNGRTYDYTRADDRGGRTDLKDLPGFRYSVVCRAWENKKASCCCTRLSDFTMFFFSVQSF